MSLLFNFCWVWTKEIFLSSENFIRRKMFEMRKKGSLNQRRFQIFIPRQGGEVFQVERVNKYIDKYLIKIE